MNKKWNLLLALALLAVAISLGGATAAAQGPVATVNVSPTLLTWQPQVSNDGLILTISGADGFYFRQEFAAGSVPSFGLLNQDGKPHPDGAYTYELLVVPVLDPAVRQAIDQATEENRAAVEEQLRQAGKLPEPLVQSGYFLIAGDAIVLGDADEVPPDKTLVHTGDSTIDGSLCVGFDCLATEAMGFDTLRLKEQNLRIHFDDVSNTGSFPRNDWRIVINDTTNGGASYFRIEDSTAGRNPFTIEAGARSNALYVESDGDVGIGTANPAADAHIVNGNTPTMRLEQDGSSGFTPQTWDVAGNEANFFVRDLTNGSLIPFKIRPNAPTSSIDIEGTTGDIGIGTSAPNAVLHVRRTNGTAQILVEEANGTTADRVLLNLQNNGAIQNRYQYNTGGDAWTLQFDANGMVISNTQQVLSLDTKGNLTLEGTLVESSDVNAKENFAPIDGQEVLARLAEIPITTWNFQADGPTVRHMGPTAQDFYTAFELGQDERHIAPLDTNGVALAAVQALYQMVQEKEAQITQLQQQNAELQAQNAEFERRLEALEKLVESLSQ